ncbi:MAG: hypothetical protein IH899_21025 [Planctomycetes bacterium]|nr:hypothetical protein [Planctomycetota bacterium]
MVKWIGLIGGPLLAGLVFFLLPSSYRDANAAIVEFSDAGRVTLAVMVWMAVCIVSIAAVRPVPVAFNKSDGFSGKGNINGMVKLVCSGINRRSEGSAFSIWPKSTSNCPTRIADGTSSGNDQSAAVKSGQSGKRCRHCRFKSMLVS